MRGGRLSLSAIAGETASIWRRDLRSLSLLALLLEAPLVLLDVLLHVDVTVRDVLPSGEAQRGAVLLLVYGALSHHLMAGVLETVVASSREGAARPSVRDVLRGLPWVRLFVADVLLTALVFAGLSLLVVPGVLALTWFSIVGPVINLERRGVLDGFRRAFHLVRGHDVTVGVIALSTFVVPEVVLTLVAVAAHGGGTAVELVAHTAVSVALLPLAALPLVIITFDLVALDRGRALTR